MGTVIRALEERGYSIAWRVLDAQHYGVAQRRRRVFIVGNLGDDWRTPAEILAIAESSARYSEQSNTKRKDPTYKTSDGAGSNSLIGSETVGSLQASDYKFPQQQQVHENKIVIQEVARLQAFGDYQLDEISSSLQARDYKGATDLVIQPTFFYAKNHQDVRIQGDVINTLAATMGTGGGNTPMVHAIQNTVIGRKDTSGPQGKGYGDEDDPMFTLDTTSPHAVATASTVRRLTPTECERLQGFPDNWTEGQADSHRYKQLGNAVAVPVVEWIIKRFIQATN
jgi:DNA (cytosine-5)-methyltransferase 1